VSATETTSGVSFALSDEQRALRELAREFAAKEIRPVAADYDERSQHPADVIAKAHEVGLMNPHIPEEYGGPGLSAFEQILIGEELAWGCSGIATSIVANILGSLPVLLAGSDEQKRAWLTPLVEEPLLCSFALTEPGAGSDVSAIQTTAELRDGDYVLNGSKMFITNAGQAAWFVVFASTDREAGHRGLSAFVVPAESEGVIVEEHLDKLGQRATDTSALAFHEARVPAANRLGDGGRGVQDRDADARPDAAGYRGGRRRRCARGIRARGRVLQEPGPVRPADRDQPGCQLPRRRHGRGDRGRQAVDVAGCVADRPG
jgi:acyl-CoA dehydrogenase